MDIISPSKNEFETCMAQGFDWEGRLRLIGDIVEQILEEHPERHFRNGALTSEILRSYDIGGDRQHPLYKPVSAAITALGKYPDFEKYIRFGKTIWCGRNRRTGEKIYARERIWALDPTKLPPKTTPSLIGLTPEEADEFLKRKGYKIIKPEQTND